MSEVQERPGVSLAWPSRATSAGDQRALVRQSVAKMPAANTCRDT